MNRALYVVPETVCMSVTGLLFVVIFVSVFVLGLCKSSQDCFTYFLHCLFRILKLMESGINDSEYYPKSVIRNFEVPTIYLYWLAGYFVLTIYMSSIVFIDVFLIDVTTSCNPTSSRTDCFLKNDFSNLSLSDEPIDCNNLEHLPDNATFICYKYWRYDCNGFWLFNIGGAVGTAGGMTATAFGIINFFTGIFLYCKQKYDSAWCRGFVCCFAFALVVVFATIFIFSHAYPPSNQILTEGSLIVSFQYFFFLGIMSYALLTCFPVYLCFDDEPIDKQKQMKKYVKKIVEETDKPKNPAEAVYRRPLPLATGPKQQKTADKQQELHELTTNEPGQPVSIEVAESGKL